MTLTDSAGATEFTGAIQEALIQRIGRDLFRLWFGQVVECRRADETIEVMVAAQFALDRIGSRYMKELRQAIADVCGTGMQIQLKLAASQQPRATVGNSPAAGSESGPCEPAESRRGIAGRVDAQSSVGTMRRRSSATTTTTGIDESDGATKGLSLAAKKRNIGWQHVVVGKSNKLAVTAAKMVCETPGSASPLFVWGNTGTGKTHLLNVIAHDLRRRHRFRRVIAMTAEEFTNDFLGSLAGSGLPGFRRRYRDVDALLLDEVQFLPGKRATSREMLYTVDAIMRAGKQLVFAADRPPLEIPGLGVELAGRMASGMVCSVSPLDSQTRIELLQRLCAERELELDARLIHELGSRACGDGRVLSGIACRLKAVTAMHDGRLTRDQIDVALSDLIALGHSACGFSEIQSAVCNVMGVPSKALQSSSQSRTVSQARMLAMYLAREHTGATYEEIGDYFGRRSHSAVIAANRRMANNLASDKSFAVGKRQVPIKQMLETVQSMIRSG